MGNIEKTLSVLFEQGAAKKGDLSISLFPFDQFIFRTFDQHALFRGNDLDLIIQGISLTQIFRNDQSAQLIKLLNDPNIRHIAPL